MIIESCMIGFAKQFFARVQQRELGSQPNEKRPPVWLWQLLRTVGVFIIAPLMTLLALWVLELPFTDNVVDAMHSALIRTDVIFLSFSLALTVILEWTITSQDNLSPAAFVVLEGILGIASIIFYAVEEILEKFGEHLVVHPQSSESAERIADLGFSTSALMVNRELIHVVLLLAVIFVGIVGYFRRIYKARQVPKV